MNTINNKWNSIKNGQPETAGWYYLAFVTPRGMREVQQCWWDKTKWLAPGDFDLVELGHQLVAWQKIPVKASPEFPVKELTP